jgi:hypothetical protein
MARQKNTNRNGDTKGNADQGSDKVKYTPTVGVDERKQGPTSLAGLEASELPDGGRGPVETDYGKEAARNLPQNIGGVIGGEVGERGHPELVKADARGGRKRN